MSGLLDSNEPVTEEAAANEIMQEYGFEPAPEPEQAQAIALEPGPLPTFEDLSGEEAAEPEQLTELDNEFAEAERRLSKAILYRQLIKGRFFDGDSELVLEVESELKEFVKKQYLVLSGAGVAPVVTQVVEKDFSTEEITALKELAGRILKKPNLLDAPKPPQLQPRPVSKPIPVATPQVAKKPPVAPAKRPQLQTRKVPEDVPQSKPVAKPAAKPVQKPQQVRTPVLGKLTVPADESVIEENGQKFKVHYVDMPNIDEFGIMDGGKIRKMADKGTCILSNGIQVFKDGGMVQKVIKSALTNNVDIPGRLPWPTNDQLSVMSQNNALEAVTKYPSLNAVLGRK